MVFVNSKLFCNQDFDKRCKLHIDFVLEARQLYIFKTTVKYKDRKAIMAPPSSREKAVWTYDNKTHILYSKQDVNVTISGHREGHNLTMTKLKVGTS